MVPTLFSRVIDSEECPQKSPKKRGIVFPERRREAPCHEEEDRSMSEIPKATRARLNNSEPAALILKSTVRGEEKRRLRGGNNVRRSPIPLKTADLVLFNKSDTLFSFL